MKKTGLALLLIFASSSFGYEGAADKLATDVYYFGENLFLFFTWVVGVFLIGGLAVSWDEHKQEQKLRKEMLKRFIENDPLPATKPFDYLFTREDIENIKEFYGPIFEKEM